MRLHAEVTRKGKLLGYLKSSSGCCEGATWKWIEACILDEEEEYDARLYAIYEYQDDALVQDIATIKDEAALDIRAFYDGIELYHNPKDHSAVFATAANVQQRAVDIISPLAASERIMQRGGLIRIYSRSNIYTVTELKVYLDRLGIILAPSIATIGIVLYGAGHTIGLIYNKGWKCLDINKHPSKFFNLEDTSELAQYIFTRLSAKAPNSYMAFCADVITTGDNKALYKLKKALAEFNSQDITQEVAAREINGVGLTLIAARTGEAVLIAKLAERGANLHAADQNGFTPLYSAAQCGHDPVIEILIAHGVNVDAEGPDGYTPIHIATNHGNVSSITILAKNGAKVNAKNKHGVTPLFIAITRGHIPVIVELIKLGVDVKAPLVFARDVLITQLSLEEEEVYARLNDFINSHKLDNEKVEISPYDIAMIMGSAPVIQSLHYLEQEAELQNNLNSFYNSMESIHNDDTRQIVLNLSVELQACKDEAFIEPNATKLAVFAEKVSSAIEKATLALQQDLSWNDYLTNIVKLGVNSVTKVVTLGFSYGFFAYKLSPAAHEAQSIHNSIKNTLSSGCE